MPKDKIDLLEEKINQVMALGSQNVGIMVMNNAKKLQELEATLSEIMAKLDLTDVQIQQTQDETKLNIKLKLIVNGVEMFLPI